MAIEWLSGNRLRGTTAERPALGLQSPSVGGWVEVGRTTLGSAGDTISVTSLPAKRYYMILQNILDGGGGSNTTWNRFNNDSGANYARRISNNGGADGTGTSENELKTDAWGGGTDKFFVHYLANKSDKEKLITGHMIDGTNRGAGYVPNRTENVFKWANTTSDVSRIDALNQGSGNYASGSEVVVLGWDPADTHTSNFWEELASVELGATGDDLDSGIFTSKKYLWIQACLLTSGNTTININFNKDTGSNYAYRRNINGGTDSTGTSQTRVQGVTAGGTQDMRYFNMFVINNSSNEKLCIAHGMTPETAGAANAPARRETVFKWANTSEQIDEIDLHNENAGDYLSGSILKVWGAN